MLKRGLEIREIAYPYRSLVQNLLFPVICSLWQGVKQVKFQGSIRKNIGSKDRKLPACPRQVESDDEINR